MTTSLILFVLVFMIYIMLSDIITIFFRLTGLTEEKARFQVISLLTNSGFTTKESEAVVSSKVRRKLARATMMFGYAFNVTIVSVMVNFFLSLEDSELTSILGFFPLILLILLGFFLLRRSPALKAKFDHLIQRLGNRIMFGKHSNPVVLVEDYGDTVAAQVYLHQVPPSLQGTPLAQSCLRSEYGILVMLVRSRNGETKQAHPDTILQADDLIMVLGPRRNIRTVFERVD